MLYSIKTRLSDRFTFFRRDENASMSIEALIIIPAILMSVATMFTLYDYFRAKNTSLRANYAISDLLSRETNPVDSNYLEGVHDLFSYLAPTGDTTRLRVTVVECVQDCGSDSRQLRSYWSYASGTASELSSTDINNDYTDIIPLFSSGEYLIMVETSVDYTAPFTKDWSGIGDRTIDQVVITPPRFAPKLDFTSS